MFRKFLVSLVLLSLCLPVFADDDPAPYTSDKNILVVSYSSDELQLDPAHSYTTTEAQLYTAFYEGLVGYHPLTLEPIPAAASRWVVSPDGLTYTFFLRPEGEFWNGDQVKADHFRDAWFRILDPEEKAEYSFMFDIIEGAYEYRTGATADRDDVAIVALSPLVLQVKLKQPADYFLKILCHHSFSPVHPLNLEDGKWKEGPSVLGNGPFYIYSRDNQRAVLRKNILYWDNESVSLDEIHILFLEDPQTASTLFNIGDIHWAASGLYLNSIDNSDYIVTNPLFGTTYFFFTTFDEALKNPDVRRALCLILPWEQIRTANNFFIPSATLIPNIPGYTKNEGISKRNMQEALQLLHRAGYTKGRGINPIVIRIPEGQDSIFIAGVMKQQWEKFLDVEVIVETLNYTEYFNSLKKPGYSVGTTTWIGDYADPLTFLQMWTAGSNLNDSGFDDPLYNSLLEEAVKEDPEERYRMMAEAEKILLDTGLVMPLENYPAFNAVNTDVLQGWFPNVLDIHPFKYMNLLKPGLPRNLVSY